MSRSSVLTQYKARSAPPKRFALDLKSAQLRRVASSKEIEEIARLHERMVTRARGDGNWASPAIRFLLHIIARLLEEKKQTASTSQQLAHLP